jgi:NADPH-dependent 2,4-dienoyl-CoA reductase/sulfur reductase-like enzyme
MVGGGIYNIKDTVRKNEDLYNKWVNFINLSVVKIDPDNNLLITEDGSEYTYDHLVITSGLVNDYDRIKGKIFNLFIYWLHYIYFFIYYLIL